MTASTFAFHCSQCRARFQAKESDRGRRFRCPKCGAVGAVPAAAEPAPLPPPLLAASPVFAPPPRLRTAPPTDDEIDMTPMIDVVFQLLIFFMVTSAFALQKALPMPTPEASDAAGRQSFDPPEEHDVLTLRVDADGGLWVEDLLAIGREDLIAKLRKARTTLGPRGEPGPRILQVEADPEAEHQFVVMALDCGSVAGMEEVRLAGDEEPQ